MTPKRCPFHYRGLECKSRSQETPGVTGKFGLGIRNEAGQRLIEFCQENTLVRANTLFQQHKRRFYTWTSPDGQHWNQTDYILCSWEEEKLYSQLCEEALYSQQKQLTPSFLPCLYSILAFPMSLPLTTLFKIATNASLLYLNFLPCSTISSTVLSMLQKKKKIIWLH